MMARTRHQESQSVKGFDRHSPEGIFPATITGVELVITGDGPRAAPIWRVTAHVREAATGREWEASADVPLTPPYVRLLHLLDATNAPINRAAMNAYEDGARLVGRALRVRTRSVLAPDGSRHWASEMVQFHRADTPGAAEPAGWIGLDGAGEGRWAEGV